jgi:hypothetical protein
VHQDKSKNSPGGNIDNEKLQSCIKDLSSKDASTRLKARHALVSMGTPAVGYLGELLNNPQEVVRHEAVKALNEIADPDSGPLFIKALEDTDSDIRWAASEGLISLHKNGLIALFTELAKKTFSVNLRKGAHNIIKHNMHTKFGEDLKELFEALESNDAELRIPPIAEKLLSKFKKPK